MLRITQSLPGLLAGLLVIVLAVTGAMLSLEPAIERARAVVPATGQISVASVAAKATATRSDVERIVRTASGSVIVYHFQSGRPRADRIDPATGAVLAPNTPSGFMQTVTNLHRSLLLGDSGRAAAVVGAFLMVVLAVSGAMMLARRVGGWTAILKPIKGTAAQRWHAGLSRFAVVGLLLSGLTGIYLSLATFELVSDGMTVEAASPDKVNGGPRLPVARLRALQAVDLNDLRELTFPYAKDLSDVYGLTTSRGIGRIDCVFRPMSATHSDAFRPPVPTDVGHRFRSKPATPELS